MTILFEYRPGWDTDILDGTHTRADATSCATYIDSDGVLRTVAANVLRDAHYVNGTRVVLTERGSTNILLRSEDFGTTWSAVGSPTRTAGAHTLSGVSLDLIGDDDGAASEYYSQSPSFTGDGVKGVSLFMKAGTSQPAGGSALVLGDNTAGANRLVAIITWTAAGVPSVSASTGTYIGYLALKDGVYRLLFQTTAVVAANSHDFSFRPCIVAAQTGNVYAGGVQIENAIVPTSYIKTLGSQVTRTDDALSFAYAPVPQEMTLYIKGIELGTVQQTNLPGLVAIGGANDASVYVLASSGSYVATHRRGSDVTSSPSGTSSVLSTLELRIVLGSNGSITLGQSINGAAETVGTTSAANVLASAWFATTLYLNSRATLPGLFGFEVVRIAEGTQTLDTMRTDYPLVIDGTPLGVVQFRENEPRRKGSVFPTFNNSLRSNISSEKRQFTVTTAPLGKTDFDAAREAASMGAAVLMHGTLLHDELLEVRASVASEHVGIGAEEEGFLHLSAVTLSLGEV